MVPSVTAPFSINFMLLVPLASLEARLICSGNVAGRDHFLGSRNIIVLDHHDFQPLADLRIAVDHLLKTENSMDDIFGNRIGRSGFRTEERRS